MRVIAYTYEGDHHCIDCTVKRYQSGEFDKAPTDYPYYNGNDTDQNRVGYDSLDSEGNYVHPVFSTDEWQNFDPSFLADFPTQYLECGNCHTIIDEYTDWRNWYE